MSIDEKTKKEIKKDVKLILNILESKKISKDDKLLISDFKNSFIICEIIYKNIELKIKKSKNNNKELKIQDIELRINNIKKYLNLEMGYGINEELLDNLFGKEVKRNHMSVKKLRNSLTHDIKKEDIRELKNRKKELFKYMNDFIKVIKKQKVN